MMGVLPVSLIYLTWLSWWV